MRTDSERAGGTRSRGDSEELLCCRALEVGYAGRALLPPVDLVIRRGETWAVVGRNGSGKSTWLRTLLGLVPPVRGEVSSGKRELRLAYLAQRSAFDEAYPLSVRDVVAMGQERGLSFIRPRARRELEAAVRAALEAMGILALAEQPFRDLSEGQKQRVLFARVAMARADLAVLDEPTSAMDLVAEREAFELLARLQRETGVAIVVVSHYLGLARRFADRAVLLDRDTPAVVVGTPDDVFSHSAFRARYGDSVRPPSEVV
jgi:zinc transport system ATP-binding protein